VFGHGIISCGNGGVFQIEKTFCGGIVMKPENAIEVHNITKRFKVYLDKGRTLKELLLFSKRRKYEEREVLKGISFEVKKGEAIGLIGHNGCGKSTTLKLLTKIMYPDSGTIEMKGRVSSLIELGAGFHPDMSGRQNIYTNASIFGLTRKEIDDRLNDIIAFSELEEFIDNPVRTYSSGMYMRLAFSVAINVDADILLIDEILAVGDANFQAKCFNKLREIKANGATIVIVSHSLGQIEQICERSIWIHDGLIRCEGPAREVHPVYLDYMGQKRVEVAEKEAHRQANRSIEVAEQKAVFKKEQKISIEEEHLQEIDKNRWGNGKARIINIEISDRNNKIKSVFETGEDINIRLKYKLNNNVKNAVIGIGVFRNDGVNCYGTNTRIDHLDEFDLKNDGAIELLLKNVQLLPGKYLLDFAIEEDNGIPVDYYREATKIELYSKRADTGIAHIEHEWIL
jgi:ABC-type polysaccharide/polyol phosphate transport system ATPase subunit